jgi:glycosyltransferase involved in cell wall biosynthesis
VAALALGERGPYVLTVGTIEPRKNLPFLLAAYDRLVTTWPAAPGLVLAGREGWLADDTWRALGRLTARERVTWVEGPTTAELALLYAGARALAFPSRYEGFGLPALEAMACGTPVLATDGSALREVVADGGWLLPLEEATWADALATIATDDAAHARLATAGQRRAAQFTWESTAAATLAVYRRVLTGG